MGFFKNIGASNSGSEEFVTGITDVTVMQGNDGLRVYSASGRDGGIQVRTADLDLISEHDFPFTEGLGREAQLSVTTIGGKQALLITGPAQDGISGFWLDNAGNPTGTFHMPGTGTTAMTASEIVNLEGTQYVFTASGYEPGLSQWIVGADDRLSRNGQFTVGQQAASDDIFALEHVKMGTSDYLLAISAKGDALQSFKLGADGSIRLVDNLDMQDGIGINTPTALTQVTLEGQTYALLGSSGSSSITVLAVGDDGTLRATDHVFDDLNTRFNGLSVLETISIDGRAYVVAGGGDDGLSLMSLLPNGRLQHLETIVDDNLLALNNPSGLSLSERNGKISLYVSGLTDDDFGTSSVNYFEIDPRMGGDFGTVLNGGTSADRLEGTEGADHIFGNSGNDVLIGGAGDDVLVDGAGEDNLWGGSGADVFILEGDGKTDIIHDFEVGVDRIDMSQMGRFYSIDALNFTSTNTGAELSIHGETLIIQSHNAESIKIDDFSISDLIDLSHTSVDLLPEGDQKLNGSNFNDFVLGGTGNDKLIGGGGQDTLSGNAGNDVLIGGTPDAQFDAISSQVFRLYQATLDRAPDVAGHQGWSKLLSDQTLTLDQAAGGFVNSKEFQNVYGELNNNDFVTLLYNNVLNRAPDTAGLAAWTSALEGGYTRTQVVTGFSESREFKNKTALDSLEFSKEAYQSDWTDDVFRLYQATLDRVPDVAGLEGWTSALATGMEINQAAGGFANSREFKMTYDGLDDSGFVNLLYQNVLGRTADQAGLEGWLDVLENGSLRGDIVVGFSQSREFINKTAQDVEDWVLEQGTDDVMNGGAGDNVLLGGLWSDEFEFDAADKGTHKIIDFESWDRLSFVGFEYSSPEEIRTYFTQDGQDAVFKDQGVEVELLDTLIEDLDDDVFRY